MDEIFKLWINNIPNYEEISVQEAHEKMRTHVTNNIKDLYKNKDEFTLLKGDKISLFNSDVNFENEISNNSNNRNNTNNLNSKNDFYKKVYSDLINLELKTN